MSRPMPVRPRAAPPRASAPEEEPPSTYSGRLSAKQIFEGALAVWGLVGFVALVLTSIFSFGALSIGIVIGVSGSIGFAAAAWVVWLMASKSAEYTLYPDRLVEKQPGRKGGPEELTLALRDVGHLGYDGHSCVLRSGPRSEDRLAIIMRPAVMQRFWEELLHLRAQVGSESPYSVHQLGADMWRSDPQALERDPERLSGRLRALGPWGSDCEVDQGEGTPVRFTLQRESSHYWLLTREGESRPRLGIRDWSIGGSASTFDVFDERGVHVARLRGLRDVEVELGSRTLHLTEEDSHGVVREGQRVLLEFTRGDMPGVVLLRPLPQALVELLVLARAATRHAARAD